MLYNLTPSRELTQPWCESSPWGDSDQHAAYIPSRASASAVLPYVFAGTHFTYPQRDGRLSQPPARFWVGIELRTCCMTVCCSTNWAILARPGPVWLNKEDNQERHMWEILWYIQTSILVNWYIRCWPLSWITAGKGGHELLAWWSTRQCNTVPNCFCQQKPTKCWVALQQYRVGGPWNTSWSREVPPLVLC